MANEYISASDAATHLGLTATSAVADSLELVVEAVSRQIDGHCQRHFWQTAAGTARHFTAADAYVVHFGPFNDLVSASAVTENGAAVTAYRLEPRNTAGPETRPFTSMRRTDGTWEMSVDSDLSEVTVTGVWGWSAVPAAVQQAARLQVARVHKRIDAPFGVAGFGDMGAIRVVPFDHDVQQLLAPYVIHGGFA